MPHLHLIAAGGIGVSAIGRYYASLGFRVTGSDTAESDVVEDLRKEGIKIAIGHDEKNLEADTDLVVYSEAIVTKPDLPKEAQLDANVELRLARERGIRTLSYPEALGDIANGKYEIAVTGSHGKSTTTALVGTMLKRSGAGGSTIVGTKLAEFDGTNLWSDPASEYFAIEACEYRRSFLHYAPTIAVITNIDLDHLDYYRDLNDYIDAFVSFVKQAKKAVVLPKGDPNAGKLFAAVDPETRNRLDWYFVDQTGFSGPDGTRHSFVKFELQIPGEHLYFDACLAYTVGKIIGLPETEIVSGLEAYS